MKQMWKFALSGHQGTPRPMLLPTGAIVRHCDAQQDALHIWAEVPQAPPHTDMTYTPRTFVYYFTGADMPDDPGTFLGTVLMQGGRLVVHVYEVP